MRDDAGPISFQHALVRTLIVSDTHLGAVPDATERAFIEFLRSIQSDARSLLINGDLFDFWFEWGDVIPSRHYRVLAALALAAGAATPTSASVTSR